jgi:hypothetical protein
LKGIFVLLARQGAETQRINSFASLRLGGHYYFLNIYSLREKEKKVKRA